MDGRQAEQNRSEPVLCLLCPSSRPKDVVSVLKETKTKEETSSDSEDKIGAINKNLAFGKRKPELLLDGAEVVEKRKKGRPRKDKMAAALPQPFTQVKTCSLRGLMVVYRSVQTCLWSSED